MRIEACRGGVRIVLSARNLKALLTKLDMPDSACTIYMDGVYVSAERDEQHYQGREPGAMHPETERMIAAAPEPLQGD